MVEENAFRGAIEFLGKIGVYDVILPFLLVFTIIFAILEKTKILGIEKIEGKEYTKKNINSMVAFIIAFLVVASTRLVGVINEVMANVILLVLLSVCFLMLVGVFFGTKEFTLTDQPAWLKLFMILMFIGIVLIFLNALGWLEFIFYFLSQWPAEWTVTAVFLIIVLGFMWYIVTEPGAPKKEKKD